MTPKKSPDKLFADELMENLKIRIIGKKVLSFESLDSTNDVCLRLGESGVEEGVCVFSEVQKNGRGRFGRNWVCPKGKGILFSVLLRPRLLPNEVARITLASAVAAVRAIREELDIPVGIKWPNDLWYRGKKLGGILTEMNAEADRIRFVVMGMGINVNVRPTDLPPGGVSLSQIKRRSVKRLSLARRILEKLDGEYQRLKARSFVEMAKDWEALSITTGKHIAVESAGRRIEGQAVGIDEEGALWVRSDHGMQKRVLAGDVRLLR